MTDTTNDDWKPFGEAKWRDFQETVQASELQLKFAVARFNGSSASAAAKIAGYAGDHDALRRAGYAAVRSAAVVALLDLAAVNAPNESKLTDSEVDSRLAKLVRSPDPLIMLKATELHDKRKQRQRDAGETDADDGLSEWRLCRDFLCQENGASTFMLFYRARKGHMGHPANFPLLHDVYNIAQCEPFGQQIFDWCGRDLSVVMRQALQEQLADTNYQIETRRKIWAERGIIIDENGQVKLGNFPNAA